jgi:hypothetical protein
MATSTSHKIEWRVVMSLVEAASEVTVRHDGKIAVKIGQSWVARGGSGN